jgi:uncharacterized protein YbjT (DUF2867 family)/RimJ/RimL family protein N-acetyltransferase
MVPQPWMNVSVTGRMTPNTPLPHELRTSRLVLRRQRPDDAPLIKKAIDTSLSHLQSSVAWAHAAPFPLTVLEARLADSVAAFDDGAAWAYSIFDLAETCVLGGVAIERADDALTALVGPNTIETGHSLRADATGHGYATEATECLVQNAFASLGAERVVICHDPANAASEGVPRRLGFRYFGLAAKDVLPGREALDGSIRPTTKVWVREAADRPTRIADPRPVLVIGATGRIGGFVVDELLRRGASVRAMTRDRAAANVPTEVEVVSGDLNVPASLDEAFRGVSAIFLVWTAPMSAIAGAIERFAAADPSRLVFLSAPIWTPHPFFQQPNAMRTLHIEIERVLAESGIATTIVRPGMLASNAIDWWGGQIRDGDVVRWPFADVESAPIDERDVAAVAVKALLDDGHAAADHVITGPDALSHAAQVRAIGDAIGRSLRYEEMSPDEFRRATTGVWPSTAVEMLLAAWSAAVGHPAFVTNTVAAITGGRARTFHQWAANNAAAFQR